MLVYQRVVDHENSIKDKGLCIARDVVVHQESLLRACGQREPSSQCYAPRANDSWYGSRWDRIESKQSNSISETKISYLVKL